MSERGVVDFEQDGVNEVGITSSVGSAGKSDSPVPTNKEESTAMNRDDSGISITRRERKREKETYARMLKGISTTTDEKTRTDQWYILEGFSRAS